MNIAQAERKHCRYFAENLMENLFLAKCNDKSSMHVFTLSSWENFWWGLIYFAIPEQLRFSVIEVYPCQCHYS